MTISSSGGCVERGAGGARDSHCAAVPRGAHCAWPANRGRNRKSPTVPVDTPLPARAAGPIPHFRKFAFLAGATAAVLVLVLLTQVVGIMR